MEYSKIQLPSRKFIGIPVRTSNSPENQKYIALTWGRFFGEEIFNAIPNLVDDDYYGIYYDYKGDHTQSYTFMAGCMVSTLESIPDGMEGIEVPEQSYASISVEGPFPQALITKWHEIWQSNIPRNYRFDFEHYGPGFKSEKNLITIHLGINPTA